MENLCWDIRVSVVLACFIYILPCPPWIANIQIKGAAEGTWHVRRKTWITTPNNGCGNRKSPYPKSVFCILYSFTYATSHLDSSFLLSRLCSFFISFLSSLLRYTTPPFFHLLPNRPKTTKLSSKDLLQRYIDLRTEMGDGGFDP